MYLPDHGIPSPIVDREIAGLSCFADMFYPIKKKVFSNFMKIIKKIKTAILYAYRTQISPKDFTIMALISSTRFLKDNMVLKN